MLRMRRHTLLAMPILLAAVVLFGAMPVLAVEVDPFSKLDTTSWMSFDRYNAKGALPSSEPETTPDPSVLALPTKPLNPPLMPGINNDFDLRVGTTQDDESVRTFIANFDTQPEMVLPEYSWRNAADAARSYADAKAKGEDETLVPLDIRMSFLPTPLFTPAVEKPKDNRTDRILAETAIKPRADNKKKERKITKEETAALEALEAFKKQQLDAIQSDRQTLEALQNAIKDLGLGNKLNFMTGAGGSLTPETTSTAETISKPAATSAPESLLK